jgi:molybdopterin synthase sulfur carrier subunit
MPVVNLRSPLADLVGDRSVVLSGSTVGEVIATLERDHPKTKGWVLDEAGAIRRHVSVFLDGERVTADASVESDATIHIIPAISGGSYGA